MARKHLRDLAKNLDVVVTGGAVLIAFPQYIQRSSAGKAISLADSAVRRSVLRYLSYLEDASVPDGELQHQAVEKFFTAGRRAQTLLAGDETVETLVRLLGRDAAVEWRSRLDPCLNLMAETNEYFALAGTYRTESERPSLKTALKSIEECKGQLELRLDSAGLEVVFSHGEGSYSLDGETQFNVPPEADYILTSFFNNSRSMDTETLIEKSGVKNVSRAIRSMVEWNDGVLADAIRSPEGSRSGYFIDVRPCKIRT
jgi:hypothetical protein